MFCCTAAGTMLPQKTVYKLLNSKVCNSWLEGRPVGAVLAVSMSGWFEMPKFNRWFKTVFLKHTKQLLQEDIKVIKGNYITIIFSLYFML
jgi:hypothetical protein